MPSFEQNERQYLYNLQRYLRGIAVTDPSIPSPPLDGIFDTATEEAVMAFQKSQGLTATGKVDLETWNLIYNKYLTSLEKQADTEGFYIFPDKPMGYAVYPDEEHFLVMVIQYLLNELRILYDDIPENTQSGIYDAPTRQGILAFQMRNGLPPDDRVDHRTWNELNRAHRRLYTNNNI